MKEQEEMREHEQQKGRPHRKGNWRKQKAGKAENKKHAKESQKAEKQMLEEKHTIYSNKVRPKTIFEVKHDKFGECIAGRPLK